MIQKSILGVCHIGVPLMSLFVILSHCIMGQRIPVTLNLRGTFLANNSEVVITDITTGDEGGELVCATTFRPCCASPPNRYGQWYYPNGTVVPNNVTGYGFWRGRSDDGEVHLSRRNNVLSPLGTFTCEIPLSSPSDLVTLIVTVVKDLDEKPAVPTSQTTTKDEISMTQGEPAFPITANIGVTIGAVLILLIVMCLLIAAGLYYYRRIKNLPLNLDDRNGTNYTYHARRNSPAIIKGGENENFIDPVTPLVCDYRGIEHTLKHHDITLTIPEGAIPEGKVIHFKLGVALYGPFSFPGNTRPISPILWLCPQVEIEFNEPIMVTLPHCLTDLNVQELEQLGVTFVKANHNFGAKEEENMKFNFKPYSTKSGQTEYGYRKSQGFATLKTNHCCYICMTANQSPLLARSMGFCLTRIDYVSESSLHVVNFCITFFLKSCINALKSQFDGYKLKNIEYRRFKFTDQLSEDSESNLKLTVQTLLEKYHCEVKPQHGMIPVSSVDFWQREYNQDELKLEHDTGLYPPRVKVSFRPLENTQEFCTVPVTVTGSDCNLNSEIGLPLVSHFPPTSSPNDDSESKVSHFPPTSSPNDDSESKGVQSNVLTEQEHLKICGYIKVMNNSDIIRLGQALGLLRSNLQRKVTLPDDMIDDWLVKADNVMVTSGPPTWNSLCKALRLIEQPGIASDIESNVVAKES